MDIDIDMDIDIGIDDDVDIDILHRAQCHRRPNTLKPQMRTKQGLIKASLGLSRAFFSMGACISTHACHTYIHTYIYICMCTQTYKTTHTKICGICTYINTCVHILTKQHIQKYMTYIHRYMHTYTNAQIDLSIDLSIYLFVYLSFCLSIYLGN